MFQIFFTEKPKIVDYRAFCQFVDRSRFQRFALRLQKHGVYISPSAGLHSVISTVHSEEEVTITVEAVRKVLNDVEG